jgi:hypothetical protein
LGFSLPARVCFLRLSSLTFLASSISRLSLVALWMLSGTCRRSLTLRTSLTDDQRSTKDLRYSIAWRSFVDTGPILSEALCFHMRTFPSSDAERTKSAVGVYVTSKTLDISQHSEW